MFFFEKYFYILIILWIIGSCNAILPSTIKTCPRSHPEPNKCILEAVEAVRPLLATGQLGDGFETPPLEPLYLDNITMGNGNEFLAVFSDIQANGGSNFKVEKLASNLSALAFGVTVFLPKIEFTGKYSLKIKILLIDIMGKGNMKGSFTNARGIVKMRGSTRKKDDGKDYVRMDKMSMKILIKDMTINLDNLFNGDPVLGPVTNQIINNNQELYLNEITPGLEKGLSKKFLEIANNILENATYDEMFPPN